MIGSASKNASLVTWNLPRDKRCVFLMQIILLSVQ
ncbi:hypothetical protein AF91_10080 [Lacticaseibacillus paracasei N1115]|uniref:Uncharacterized protein n=1 Tax=Lacticaseibacillus paracasei N1115 TaxID=1446494 RepID=A0A806LEQ4_LACPA|nr:hypothetical protein AF91_10080 [Lacticaseibacillus paracasei N1115]